MSDSTAKKKEYEVIRGEVSRIRYHNAEIGFLIFEVESADSLNPLTVVGSSTKLNPGVEVVVTGEHTVHPKFGKQFKARDISVVEPSSTKGTIKYLASGLFPGIGEGLARRVVKHFGDSTLEVLKNSPGRLEEVSGIGRKKAEKIVDYLEENSSLHEITRFLSEHNISPRFAERIYKRYGNRSIERLRDNPYLLARDMRGVGFQTADSVAVRLGMELHAPERQKAALLYSLLRSREDGHCYFPKDKLLTAAASLLGFEIEPTEANLFLDELQDEGDIIVERDRVYSETLKKAEEWVAEFAAARCTPYEKPLVSERIAKEVLNRVQSDMDIRFSEEQRSAVLAATRYPLLVLTGGPGCGKTTVTRAIVETFLEGEKTIALTAPTGRAAQRLSQVCNQPAKTIHRLLRYDPFNNSFFYGADVPLEVEGKRADVVIIDEASMIDLPLAKDLLSSIPRDTAVILVGDRDQLPSVGPGKVFGDLLSVSKMPTIKLSLLYRREGESTINTVAHQVNAGITPSIPEPDGVTKADAYLIPRNDAEDAARMIEKLVSDQIPKKFDIPTEDITVLTPSNRGPLGTISLNERLQSVLNSYQGEPLPLPGGNTVIAPGDRVCQRKNNYQIDDQGVFNGDVGIVQSIDLDSSEATVELWDGRLINYTAKEISQLMLAYALTVHRSQGSEIPCVVLALHESHYTLLERQLIYTAVTRAKKLLVVVGSKRALMLATKRSGSKKRYCGLAERLQLLVN